MSRSRPAAPHLSTTHRGEQGSFEIVTEVMVNRPDDVFVEREGRIERVRDRLFEGEESIVHLMG